MILVSVYMWDTHIEQSSLFNKNVLFKDKEKIYLYSTDVKLTNREPVDIYKGFDINALCRYEKLASLNVDMKDYKSATMDYIDAFLELFDKYNFDEVVSWRSIVSFRKIPLLIAKQKGIKTMVIDGSAFSDRIIADIDDANVFSRFYHDYVNYYRFIPLTEKQEAEVDLFIKEYKAKKVTKIPVISSNKNIALKDYSLVILQYQNDASILYYQNGIINNEAILKYLKENPYKKYLVRNHPITEKENIPDIINFFSDYEFCDQYNLHSLLENCKEVITINSGVGIEAMCYDKPVISLGNSIYNKVINNKNFLYYYLNHFTVKIY